MSVKKIWQDFKSQPIVSIARWQDRRSMWITIIVVCVFLVVLAHSVFQNWLYMQPCEQCVYIRFAFFTMGIGALVATINPKVVVLKLIGYVFNIYAATMGLLWSFKLNAIHKAVRSDDPFGVQGCSTDPNFPFGLPLNKWSAEWFQPTGDCGFDNPIVPSGVELSGLQQTLVDFYAEGWYLWPPAHFMNMAQSTILAFGTCLIILVIAFLSWVYVSLKNKKPRHNNQ